MRLRFRQTTPSSQPDYPFQIGQIIHVSKLTPEFKRWIKAGYVEVLRDMPEAAVAPETERAVESGARR